MSGREVNQLLYYLVFLVKRIIWNATPYEPYG
jgi:hypothetical protein